MLRITHLLTLVLLLFVSCGKGSNDEGADPEATPTPTGTPDSPNNSNIIKTVGPIEVPFTLNKSNAPVGVTVAEGETRLIKMRMEIAQETETHEEKIHTVSFRQPWLAASDITESFTLDNKGIVDILLIIDDSDSMQAVHKKLKTMVSGSNLKLLKGIEHSFWRLAIADSRGDTCLRAVLDKNNVADYLKTIVAIENVTEADHHERVVLKARTVMGLIDGSCPGNLGVNWSRSKSTMAIVGVTDEDHQCMWANSPGNTGDGNTYHCKMTGKKSVADELQKIANSGVDWVKFYGIMDETATCGKIRQDASFGHCYASDADASRCRFTNPCAERGGTHKFRSANFAEAGFIIKDIHRSDYSDIFSEIVDDIKDAIQDRFLLKAKPNMSESATKKFEVSINGTKVNESLYSVDADNKILKFTNNSLQTLTAGLTNPVIQVSYQVDGMISHVHQFTVDAKADAEATGDAAMTLSINGAQKVKGTDYRVIRNTDKSITIALLGNDATRKLLFPEGATATITYRELPQYYPELVLKQTDLVLRKDGTTPDVDVYVDGVAATEFIIKEIEVKVQGQSTTVKKKVLVFNDGHQPQHGQVVRISYGYYTHTKKLSYDDKLSDKYKVSEINCETATGRQAVKCSHINGSVVFLPDVFKRDTDIRVIMKIGLEKGKITVPDNIITGSMKLAKLNDSTSVCPEDKMIISNGIIDLNATAHTNVCKFVANWDVNNESVEFTYQTYAPNQVVEVINGEILSYAGRYSDERWEVFISNVKKNKNTDYTIKGRKVTFTGNLPHDTKGRVDVYLEP